MILLTLALALGACEQVTREPIPQATATAATEPAEAVAPTATPLPLPAPRLLWSDHEGYREPGEAYPPGSAPLRRLQETVHGEGRHRL